MSESSAERNPVKVLADEFLARQRRGERPSLEEYIALFPELAEEIEEVFPVLLDIENARWDAAEPTGPAATPRGPCPGRLGDFRILREIGRGGMGIVYEAEQESLGRRVALKVLVGPALTPQQVRRFECEARSVARLHHTNIVPVFGVGQEHGIHYYAMQYISGQPLDGVLNEVRRLRRRDHAPAHANPRGRRGDQPSVADVAISLCDGRFALGLAGSSGPSSASPPAPTTQAASVVPERVIAADAPRDAPTTSVPASPGSNLASSSSELIGSGVPYARAVARLGAQVAEALAHAADQGVIHRDVKPSNILLDHTGMAWLTDFGLAKTAGQDDLTQTGDLIGTLRYMAPERFRGHADCRGDIYALGLTLYEVLTLRPAFRDSDRARLIERILRESATPPRTFDQQIPRDLETIVLKAMAREPGQRYYSAQHMADDLHRFLSDRPVLARRTSLGERLARWCKRNPAVASLLALLALVLVTGTIASTAAAFQFHELAQSEGRAKVQASRSGDAARAKSEELEWQLYSSRISQAYREWQANNLPRTRELLEACPPRLRGWEWRFVQRLCHLERLTFRGHRESPMSMAYSPDGRAVASAGGQFPAATEPGHGEILVWDAASGREQIAMRGLRCGVTGLAYSPDGKLLAASGALMGPDSRVVRELIVLEVATGKPRFIQTVVGDGLSCVAFSPDGHLLAAGCGQSHAGVSGLGASRARSCVVWNAESGQEVMTISGASTVLGVAFSLDGRRLALSRFGEIELRDLAERRIVRQFSGRPYDGYQVAFTRDGTKLISGGDPAHTLVWDVETGAVNQGLEAYGLIGLAVSPDGTRLVTGGWGEEIKLWDTTSWYKIGELRGHEGPMSGDAFRGDGHEVATATFDGTVKLWDPTMAAPREFRVTDARPTEGCWVTGVALSPDGRRLYISSRHDTVPGLGCRACSTTLADERSRRRKDLGRIASGPSHSRPTAVRWPPVTTGELSSAGKPRPGGSGPHCAHLAPPESSSESLIAPTGC